MPWWHQLPVSA